MKKLALGLIAMATMGLASGAAFAQSHGGGGWHGGGGGGWHGGGTWHGGAWHGGGWHGSHVGVYVGFPGYWWGAWPYPYWGPYGYGYSAYYPYSSYPTYQTYPTTEDYVQQAPDSGGPGPSDYWYYCTDPAGYYPYVQNCSKGWMQVVPQRGPATPQPPQ